MASTYRVITVDDLADLLSQEAIWVDRHGVEHQLDAMPRDYLAQVLTDLEDEATYLMRATRCASDPDLRESLECADACNTMSVLCGEDPDPEDPLDAVGVPVPAKVEALRWIRDRPLAQALRAELRRRDDERDLELFASVTGDAAGAWTVKTTSGSSFVIDAGHGILTRHPDDADLRLCYQQGTDGLQGPPLAILALGEMEPGEPLAFVVLLTDGGSAARFTTPRVRIVRGSPR